MRVSGLPLIYLLEQILPQFYVYLELRWKPDPNFVTLTFILMISLDLVINQI